MTGSTPIRFDDLLLDAVAAIQAMVARGKGWEDAPGDEKGRVAELVRGLAGERRHAKQAADPGLQADVDRLDASAHAQLRMLEGRTTLGDEELAERFNADVAAYRTRISAPRP
jgi:hypothetical protein